MGNYTSKRIGGIIYPELGGFAALLKKSVSLIKRKTNPFSTTAEDRQKLSRTIPFWFRHNLSFKAFKSQVKKYAYVNN
ncbi:MAG: hypothetical protein R2875_18780 [Desulfobacterales bacterium]